MRRVSLDDRARGECSESDATGRAAFDFTLRGTLRRSLASDSERLRHERHWTGGHLLQETADLAAYLGGSAIINLDDPAVRSAHDDIVAGATSPEDAARRVFLFIRDRIRHSWDADDQVATLSASDVLTHRTGLCFAKSHLAAALMRLSRIQTALCFQRLRDGDALVLHGLIAVHLNGAWHRLDVRGNKPGLNAEFSLERERLAYTVDGAFGEADLPDLLVDAAPPVVECLRATTDILSARLPSALA